MPHYNENYCHYCGVSSLWKKKSYMKNDRRYDVKCNICQKGMCGSCCVGFQKAMDETKYIDREFWASDPIYNTLSGANTSLHILGNDEFRLPCCEKWDQVRIYNSGEYINDESSSLKEKAHETDLNVCVIHKTLALEKESGYLEKRSQKRKHTCVNTILNNTLFIPLSSLDGCLVYPSYHLMIPGYIGIPQTHVVGPQTMFPGEKGIPHAVLDPVTAHKIDMEYYKSFPKKTKVLRSITDSVVFPDIHGDKIEKKVQWIILQMDRGAHISITKYCSPTYDQIISSSILSPESEEIDVFAILGEPWEPKADYYLLACLFIKTHSLQNWDWSDSHLLFNEIKGMLPKNGYETARTGGSLGVCLKNNETRQFIYRKGSFPRKRSACRFIIVNTLARCGVLCYYCSKSNHQYVGWFYNTPRIGGHVKIELLTATEYPFFTVFPECRVQTALMILYFNMKAKSSANDCKCLVSKAALDFLNEMCDIPKLLEINESWGVCLSLKAQHSLVTHPVGFHLDAFSAYRSSDMIENKICLFNVQKSDSSSKLALGRGGCGPGVFVYAILDWGRGMDSNKVPIQLPLQNKVLNRENWNELLNQLPFQRAINEGILN